MHGLNLLKTLNKGSYDVTCSCWHFTWVFGYYVLVLCAMLQPKWQTCCVNEANQHARKCPRHIEACEQQSMTNWLCALSCFCSLSVPFNSVWSRGWRYVLPLNWNVQINGYSEWNTHSHRKFHLNINFITHIREKQQTSQGFDPLYLSVMVVQSITHNSHCVNSHTRHYWFGPKEPGHDCTCSHYVTLSVTKSIQKGQSVYRSVHCHTTNDK